MNKHIGKSYQLLPNSVVGNVFKILYHKILYFDIDSRAATVAFNLTLAIFPAIIFIFTLIPYIPIKNLDLQILNLLKDIIPSGIYNEAKETIIDIVSKKRSGVLSLGFLIALFTSTSGMLALMRTFNLTYRTAEHRGWLRQRLVAIALNIMLTILLLAAIIILIAGRQLLDIGLDNGWLTEDFNYYAINFFRYVVSFSLLFVAVSVIYFVAPSMHKRWSFVNYGSITASILIILVTNLFSYYLSNFALYNKLYGSIGTIIALMIWLYLVALILIVGFEVNTTVEQSKQKEYLTETNG